MPLNIETFLAYAKTTAPHVARVLPPANDLAPSILSLADVHERAPSEQWRCPQGVEPLDWACHLALSMPEAIQGQGGSLALWNFVLALVRGLQVERDDAREIIRDAFNPRCLPPWSDREIDHKLDDAERSSAPRGFLLAKAPPQTVAVPGAVTSPGQDTRADLGNARRLVRIYGTQLRYFTAWHRWLIWDGTRWAPDERGLIEQCAKVAAESLWEEAKAEADQEKKKPALAWAIKSQDRTRIENMIALARSEPGIPVVAGELDSDPWKFNVRNGTIDLRTGALLPHSQTDLITKLAPVDYVPGARSELWERLIKTWTNGDADLAAYIQRAVGYALYGRWQEKAFWFAYGPKDGGKSTFLNAVAAMFGDYSEGADASTWLVQTNNGGNRGDLTRLLGKRFVVTIEFKDGARFDVSVMKRITGGDAITAAAKYKDEITFHPTFALWLAANHRPKASDDDDAFMSRMRCVPFTNSIPATDQIKGLDTQLAQPEHTAAILAWAVEGCLAWQGAGLGSCAAVEAASSEYRAAMNPAADFLDECVSRKPGGTAAASAVWMAYQTWAKNNRIARPLAAKQLGRRLRDFGAGRNENNGGTWLGIEINPMGAV